MICFQNSTGLRGPAAEVKLEAYTKTDMIKNMLLVEPEGETLYLEDSVVGKENGMKENQQKRKWVDEAGGKKSKQHKLDIDLHKEKQEKLTKHKKVWDDLSRSQNSQRVIGIILLFVNFNRNIFFSRTIEPSWTMMCIL